jgi:hypothetical protein
MGLCFRIGSQAKFVTGCLCALSFGVHTYIRTFIHSRFVLLQDSSAPYFLNVVCLDVDLSYRHFCEDVSPTTSVLGW